MKDFVHSSFSYSFYFARIFTIFSIYFRETNRGYMNLTVFRGWDRLKCERVSVFCWRSFTHTHHITDSPSIFSCRVFPQIISRIRWRGNFPTGRRWSSSFTSSEVRQITAALPHQEVHTRLLSRICWCDWWYFWMSRGFVCIICSFQFHTFRWSPWFLSISHPFCMWSVYSFPHINETLD